MNSGKCLLFFFILLPRDKVHRLENDLERKTHLQKDNARLKKQLKEMEEKKSAAEERLVEASNESLEVHKFIIPQLLIPSFVAFFLSTLEAAARAANRYEKKKSYLLRKSEGTTKIRKRIQNVQI